MVRGAALLGARTPEQASRASSPRSRATVGIWPEPAPAGQRREATGSSGIAVGRRGAVARGERAQQGNAPVGGGEAERPAHRLAPAVRPASAPPAAARNACRRRLARERAAAGGEFRPVQRHGRSVQRLPRQGAEPVYPAAHRAAAEIRHHLHVGPAGSTAWLRGPVSRVPSTGFGPWPRVPRASTEPRERGIVCRPPLHPGRRRSR